jgi:serine protease Do
VKKFMRYSAVILMTLFFGSCATQRMIVTEYGTQAHQDFVQEEIDRLLDSGRDEDVLQAITRLSREANRDRIARDIIINGLRRSLDVYGEIAGSPSYFDGENSAVPVADPQLIESRERQRANYNILLAYYQNLSAEDYTSSEESMDFLPQLSEAQRLFALAEGQRIEGRESVALHYLYRAYRELGRSGFIDNGFSRETLDNYARIAWEGNNRELLAVILAALERNFPLGEEDENYEEYRRLVTSPWEASVGVEASVTIWVDKGIRLENRIGYPERSIGTGFYVDPRGYIITNYHVIESEVDPSYEGRSELFIRPGENPELRIPARVIGYDRIFDLALLKAEVEAPRVISFQSSATLRSGSQLYAIGSPGGLENTVTSGIVSAVGRRFLQMGDSLQIDAPVNPGNSGGPLFDADGRLVGVVFAGIEQFEGVNFAIPSSWIEYLFPDLFETGEVSHPWLGMALREDATGLEVLYVAPGSPAENAGFVPGDMIQALNGAPSLDLPESQRQILAGGIGALYLAEGYSSEGDGFRRLIHSGERPYSPMEEVLDNQLVDNWLPPLFGMKVEPLTSRARFNEYIITDVVPGGIADESGLSANDPFQLVNWFVDTNEKIAVLQIYIQKRSGGYLREGLQLANYIELNSFL